MPKRLSVSLEPDVYELLKKLAEKNRRSMSSEAALIIEKAFEKENLELESKAD